jgi:hypothetical protein
MPQLLGPEQQTTNCCGQPPALANTHRCTGAAPLPAATLDGRNKRGFESKKQKIAKKSKKNQKIQKKTKKNTTKYKKKSKKRKKMKKIQKNSKKNQKKINKM